MSLSPKKIQFLFIAIFSIFSLFCGFSLGESTDLLQQAFSDALQQETILDIGKTSKDVGEGLLRSKTTNGDAGIFKACFDGEEKLAYNNKSECEAHGGRWGSDLFDIKEPLIVKITKFLLRITMVLSITMVIFCAVKYLIEVIGGKDIKSAAAKKDLINIAVGIIVALMSVTIVNLLVSIPKSSIKTEDDSGDIGYGCSFYLNGSSYTMKYYEFKEYLCKNYQLDNNYTNDLSSREWKWISSFSVLPAHIDNVRTSSYRCKITTSGPGGTRMWIKIKNDLAKKICTNDLRGTYGFFGK